MNDVGKLITARRLLLGFSREHLADLVGVTSQTILNIERDRDYNVGTRVLLRLEEALDVEFEITIKEKREMNDRISMGNEEFILYIRKNFPDCNLTNAQLGKSIWIWLRQNADAQKTLDNQPCLWGDHTPNLVTPDLPVTATQFNFNREVLPDLYRFLDKTGKGK
jgi:transcriptional regulator with XRE-family HTH domain